MTTDSIDFFIPECQTENIQAACFGICDPQNGGKAYVAYNNEDMWIATVKNRSGIALNFTAIDNCIDIRRPDGKMENRCDGMLTGGDYIIFIELKDQASNWIGHAVEDQLQTTIDCFNRSNLLLNYKKRFAYACNKRHPQFQYSRMDLMNEFMRKNKVRLCIVNTIVVK